MKQILPYLNFDGTCREAMEFYKKCLGAELYLLPFSEAPGDFPKDAKDGIMHATLTKGIPLFMASDAMPGTSVQPGNNVSMTIQLDDPEETERLFTAFGENGKVTMSLQETFWAASFGMLTDQFGIQWLFNCERPNKDDCANS